MTNYKKLFEDNPNQAFDDRVIKIMNDNLLDLARNGLSYGYESQMMIMHNGVRFQWSPAPDNWGTNRMLRSPQFYNQLLNYWGRVQDHTITDAEFETEVINRATTIMKDVNQRHGMN